VVLYTSVTKNYFKRGIGIAEKSHETRRDRWGGNVNHKSYLTLHDPYTSFVEWQFSHDALFVEWQLHNTP